MKNALVARILNEIADLLDLQGVAFKPRAYRRAAEVVSSLGEPIEGLVAQGTHGDLPGIGDAIAKKIVEIVDTGCLEYHERLKAELPIDLHGLTSVEGVGPKTAKLLYDELGIRNLDDLEAAARAGRIASVKGLGAKTEAKILHGLEETRRVEDRLRLGDAMPIAEDLMDRLRSLGRFERLQYAGSLRRGRETIGDLDLLGIASDSRHAMAAFVGLPDVRDVLAHGETKSSVRLDGGLQVDLRIVPEESFGAALQYFTGSQSHNIALRKRAVARGWKLNEYGLYDEQGRATAGPEEAEIYGALDLAVIPPELREDRDEIQAAERCGLPRLVELSDIRVDLHVHTDWSDGRATIDQMVDEAKKRGLEAIAITDHAHFAEVVRGLKPDDVRRQIDVIARLNEASDGIRVLSGIEVNVQPDGTLDMPDELLARLDVVIASVHSHFRQPRDEATARWLRTIGNPNVDILGHPSTRKIGIRAAMDVDWDAVFEAAAKRGVALEVNANPIRMDLNGDLVRRAIALGCRIAINTDAHHPDHFDFLRYGVVTARRGWATRADVATYGD